MKIQKSPLVMNACWRFVVLCAIWYHLYNLKNVKNIQGGALILVQLQDQPATLLKLALLRGCFSRFKLNKWYQIAQRITFLSLLLESDTFNRTQIECSGWRYTSFARGIHVYVCRDNPFSYYNPSNSSLVLLSQYAFHLLSLYIRKLICFQKCIC